MTLVSTAAKASSGGGSVTQLFDTTLSGAAASIDSGAGGFSASYRHLLIIAHLRSNLASTVDAASVRFNNDSTAVYYTQVVSAFAGTAGGAETLGATSFNLVDVSGASAPASVFSPVTLFVPNYSSTAIKKSLTGMFGFRTGSGTGNLETLQALGYWDATAAIARVAVTAASGQFVAGSSLTIYGLS